MLFYRKVRYFVKQGGALFVKQKIFCFLVEEKTGGVDSNAFLHFNTVSFNFLFIC